MSKFIFVSKSAVIPNVICVFWRNFAESDLRYTLRIYFDNVTLTLHNVTLGLQKPTDKHNNKRGCSVVAAKQMLINFSIKYRYSDILLKTHKLHLFC